VWCILDSGVQRFAIEGDGVGAFHTLGHQPERVCFPWNQASDLHRGRITGVRGNVGGRRNGSGRVSRGEDVVDVETGDGFAQRGEVQTNAAGIFPTHRGGTRHALRSALHVHLADPAKLTLVVVVFVFLTTFTLVRTEFNRRGGLGLTHTPSLRIVVGEITGQASHHTAVTSELVAIAVATVAVINLGYIRGRTTGGVAASSSADTDSEPIARVAVPTRTGGGHVNQGVARDGALIRRQGIKVAVCLMITR